MALHAGLADSAAADAHDVLLGGVHLDARLGVLFADGVRTVALLVFEPRGAADDALALGRRRECRECREKVGAVRGVEFEGAQGPVRGRHGVLVVDDRGPGPHECRADGRVGLLRKHGDVLHGDFARDGARHEQHGRGAPVPLDAEKSRAVALSALDVELLVVVMADFHAETCRRVDGHVQIGGRDGAADVERGVVLRERERQQQPRDELRRNRAVDVDLPYPDAEAAQRVDHHVHGTP